MADHGRNPDQKTPGIGLLAVLLGAVAAGPIMLYGLSATSDSIIAELGISEAHFGLLATTCFGAAAIGNATLGRLADRHSDLSLMAFIFVLAALALLLVAVPDGFWLLLVAAALSGIAQSFPNGVTNRILLERVPDTKRIGWVGIKQSGVQVSQLRHPGMVWALALFGLINGIGVQATNVYIPLFAVREMGFSLVLGGATAALAGVIGVIARVTWARRMAKGASGPACCWSWPSSHWAERCCSSPPTRPGGLCSSGWPWPSTASPRSASRWCSWPRSCGRSRHRRWSRPAAWSRPECSSASPWARCSWESSSAHPAASSSAGSPSASPTCCASCSPACSSA